MPELLLTVLLLKNFSAFQSVLEAPLGLIVDPLPPCSVATGCVIALYVSTLIDSRGPNGPPNVTAPYDEICSESRMPFPKRYAQESVAIFALAMRAAQLLFSVIGLSRITYTDHFVLESW